MSCPALSCRVALLCRVVSPFALLQCVTRDTYVAALTRYKESFIGLPLPPSLGDSHDANVDQARKDLGRETSILLNGTLFPLGSGSAFVRFLLALVDTVSLACVSDVVLCDSAGGSRAPCEGAVGRLCFGAGLWWSDESTPLFSTEAHMDGVGLHRVHHSQVMVTAAACAAAACAVCVHHAGVLLLSWAGRPGRRHPAGRHVPLVVYRYMLWGEGGPQ